jgi:ribosomal protein L7/L12
MRINLKRLTDAVPELMELEFIAEDTAILISTTISIAQAEDLFECFRKALTAHYNDKAAVASSPARGAPCATAPGIRGMSVDCYKDVMAFLRENLKINAIKRIREGTSLGLKEAKDIADDLYEKLQRGELT